MTTQLYVATTGSDSNNGLTSGAPFATLQHAGDVARTISDTVTVNVANGTYSAGLSLLNPISNDITFSCSATPSSVIIQAAICFEEKQGAHFYINGGFELQGSTYGINCELQGFINFSGVVFGVCGYHMRSHGGAYLETDATYTIKGNAIQHVRSSFGGTVMFNASVGTFSANVTFSSQFAYCSFLSRIGTANNNSWNTNGFTVTGPQYLCQQNSVIQLLGMTQTSLPGSAAGTCLDNSLFLHN